MCVFFTSSSLSPSLCHTVNIKAVKPKRMHLVRHLPRQLRATPCLHLHFPRLIFQRRLGTYFAWDLDENGKTIHKEFRFAEEPLGLPASDGHGYSVVRFTEVVGPEGRYCIERKLAWTLNSTIWLAKDLRCGLLQTSPLSANIQSHLQQ